MITWRSKYWLMLCGADIIMTITFAAGHNLYGVVFAFLLTVWTWHMANGALERDTEAFYEKLNKGE